MNEQLLADLRSRLAASAQGGGPKVGNRVTFGTPFLDSPLGGGIARGALHEVYAAKTSDLSGAMGFSVGLAMRAAQTRPILWVRQDFLETETGRLHPPGLAELGLDPSRILLVRAHDAQGVLRAGAEAVRCSALGAVLIEPWGEPSILNLTASRRLALAAEASGVMTVLLRTSPSPQASAARTRWQVCPLPSHALEANAPGNPAFGLQLLRHRGGVGEGHWRVEWCRERQAFQERSTLSDQSVLPKSHADASLSRSVVPFPADGSSAQGEWHGKVRKSG